jgi:dCMP deaminase
MVAATISSSSLSLPGDDSEQPEKTPRHGANCYGSKLGAVLVREDRIIGTGYIGTPAGFTNCINDGCIRCKDRWLDSQGRRGEMSDEGHTAGASLDRCICVHAEQNALLTAARFGIRVDRAVLYVTLSPCFGCLKEAIQAGVTRIVYEDE